MRIKRYDGTELRIVLISMITTTATLARIYGQWSGEGLFDAKWANLVGSWCIQYFTKYRAAPGNRITRLFELWAQKAPADDKVIEAVEQFLQSLSDNHIEVETQQVIDIAEVYFNKVRGEKELEQAKVEFDNGMVVEAWQRIQRAKRINFNTANYINLSNDVDFWLQVQDQQYQRPLVRYPGDLGVFTAGAFCRGEFYSFVAPDKTGKSTYLRDFCYRAVRQRNRVAFFDMGDSNEIEVGDKIAQRASGCPKFETILRIPNGWEGINPTLIDLKFTAVDGFEAFKAFQRICKNNDVCRLSCHRNSTCTVRDIEGILDDWDRLDGWRPDVVGIDYADILAKPKGINEKLEAIGENWRAMRRMSQERNCLVMTATQSKSTGYTKTNSLLGPEDFSGSKEKNAHVNGMLGINVSPAEKAAGAGRINWCPRREGESNQQWFCRVAGHYAIRNPILTSKNC